MSNLGITPGVDMTKLNKLADALEDTEILRKAGAGTLTAVRVPDINVLVNAVNSARPQHETAHAWIESAMRGSETVGFAVVALLGFVRVTTKPAVCANPLSPMKALDQLDAWLSAATATLNHPGPRHMELLRSLLEHTGTAGNLTTDAHLAALALEQRATLATFDGDFHRFPSLKLDYLH